MLREVRPELLDLLPASDLSAVASRRDLRLINVLMRHANLIADALQTAFSSVKPKCIVELGAGDGTLLLQVAKRLGPRWRPARVILVDRQELLSHRTRAEFGALFWPVESVVSDVFDWLERPGSSRCEVMTTGLFLHHFCDTDLQRLFRLAAGKTDFFLACEPRREPFALCAAGLLGLIGCNQITRHDACVSVRAGFRHTELSALWPAEGRWRLREHPAGLFSHCFSALRAGEVPV